MCFLKNVGALGNESEKFWLLLSHPMGKFPPLPFLEDTCQYRQFWSQVWGLSSYSF